MELKDAIQNRASVRNFINEPVNPDDLREMVRRAGLAPSENNHQPWKFFAISNKELLVSLAKSVTQKIREIPASESKYAYLVKSQMEMSATFFKLAPSVIAMAMTPSETIWEKGINISHDELKKMHNYPDLQSAGAAIQNILLTAVELGYGACWMSSPLTAKNELEALLGIAEPWELISFVAVGKAAQQSSQSNKKSLDEIFELIS
ncbi:nitroreductase family protein [Bacteroidota bacterium]